MGYGYKVVNGKVFVIPIVYVCQQCSFKTQDQEEEKRHYYEVGHFAKSTLLEELTEEWNEAKHGALPSWVKVT